jgi:hypothetical protein
MKSNRWRVDCEPARRNRRVDTLISPHLEIGERRSVSLQPDTSTNHKAIKPAGLVLAVFPDENTRVRAPSGQFGAG